MSIQSVSFWQQDQSYWQTAHAQSQASAAGAALINVMATAMTNLSRGKATIANGEALKRTNTQLTAAIQNALESTSGGSTPSSSSSASSSSAKSSSSSSSASSSSTQGAPAVGIGTARLTTSTLLSTLGILRNGTINVGAGGNVTTYTSTGTDTVGDLINAINIDLPTNARATATLNSKGQIVLTGRDDTSTITVNGSGTDASVIGFGIGNTAFMPTTPSSSASSASSAASSSTASTGASSSSTSSSKTASKSPTTNSALALQSFKTAASILSASGAGGTLVDMLS